jgi:hypothetical protein
MCSIPEIKESMPLVDPGVFVEVRYRQCRELNQVFILLGETLHVPSSWWSFLSGSPVLGGISNFSGGIERRAGIILRFARSLSAGRSKVCWLSLFYGIIKQNASRPLKNPQAVKETNENNLRGGTGSHKLF